MPIDERAWQNLFKELRSPRLEARFKAATDLRNMVVAAHRELQPDRFVEFYNSLNSRLASTIVMSQDPNEKIGGILVMEALLDFGGEDAAAKVTRFSGFLRAALRSNDGDVLIYAARALGRLATPGGALTADLVDSEVKTALEWLTVERSETKRFAAALVIRELAKSSPTLIFAYIPQILEYIWSALRDPKILIRETAAEAVATCFEILAPRDVRTRTQWFTSMWNECLVGFKAGVADYQHGSLLIMRELLTAGGMFMQDHYREACEIDLQLKAHKDAKIRSEVVQMIPILASYAPTDFCALYLQKFMVFLTGQLKKDRERSAAYQAIGKIATAISASIVPYLDGLMNSIKDGLKTKAKSRDRDGSIFHCISMLSMAVGQAMTKFIEDGLLDIMFACGLSDALTQALVDMAHYVAPVKAQIQDKLLDLVSLVLCNKPFKPLGCPDNRLPPIPQFAKEWQQSGISHGDNEIALALHTLGSFDFKGHTLNEFVRDVALPYVKSYNAEIRRAAALTCCQIYVQDPIIKQTSYHAIGVVRSVVSQLLNAAVADPVTEIRRTVMHALDTKFDRHLAEQENVRKIIMAINEEDFEVRKAAVEILGRLTLVNPAYVFPPLRKLLSNFTQSVSASNDPEYEEQGARLVSLCVMNASSLVRPFVENLVKTLVPKATSSSPDVSATILRAIGDLSTVGGLRLQPYLQQLMPTIIDALQDLANPPRRDAALRSLGQLASNTGYVIAPYLDHPQLLDMLTSIIKTEQQGVIRRETIKLLGILGALDPYRHQQSLEMRSTAKTADNLGLSDVALIMQGLTPSNEEYYPQVVMNILMHNVLQDSSLAQYHHNVIEAIVTIFKTLGLKCVTFLPQIIPTFISVIHSAPLNKLEQYFNQMAILISIVGQHFRPFVKDIVEVLLLYFDTSAGVSVTCLSVMESLSKALGREFYPSLVRLCPLVMQAVDSDPDKSINRPGRAMHTVLVFGKHAERSMWLILPKMIRTFSSDVRQLSVRKSCIETIGTIARQTNISDYASLLLHSLMDMLASKEKALHGVAYDCILTFLFQYPQDAEPFLDGLKQSLVSNGMQHSSFDNICTKIRNGEALPQDLRPILDSQANSEDLAPVEVSQRKLPVNQEHLKIAWEATNKSTRDDWQEWMRRFSMELLKESPSNALRACASLANVYSQVTKDLFNVAFASCWTELYDQYQEDLVHSLELALVSPHIPPEILQVLLNLAEFMEHDDKPLPIDIGTLGLHAGKCHAYAKALHYKELEFEEEKNPSVVEALITINNQLQQTDAAVGILRNAQKYRDFELKETWFEKLGRWDDALVAYTEREKEDPDSFEVTMGKMRCLHALGEWEMLHSVAESKWSLATMENKRMIAPLAAAAAWGINSWELMDTYLEAMKTNSPDRSFFKAIAAVNQSSYTEALAHIEKARDGLDTELTALLGESYTRAYGVVVRVQMIAELEETITYKKAIADPEKQSMMRETWRTRLEGCEANVETWQRMLKVRQLVLSPKENKEVWIKYANLCRKAGRTGLAKKAINLLKVNADDSDHLVADPNDLPEVCYAQYKYNWASGDSMRAMIELREFTNTLADQCSALTVAINAMEATPANPMNVYQQSKPAELKAKKQEMSNMKLLLSKCFLRLGQWQTYGKGGNWQSEDIHEILMSYHSATQYNPEGYKAWHAWSLANFEVVNAVVSQASHESAIFPQATISDHVIPAIQGFFKSIALSKAESTLQDTLRLLTLWFHHGHNPEVGQALTEGFPMVSMNTWLEVIPQLIARINQPNARVRQGVQKLLVDVGKIHPQALVYPLTVAMKSDVRGRAESAKAVMEKLHSHSPILVDQAQLVSKELIRVAVLWHELWHEGLEEASRLYFGDHNTDAMFAVLAPLHKLLEDGPQTLREISFHQAFGRELTEAKHWCETFRTTHEPGDINQAWDLYYGVFKRIARQLPQLMILDLKYISPQLRDATNLELVVPGTYQSGKPIVRIMSFDKIFTVFATKQRPRKMTLKGSDGQSYTFLLKGHEDIRQDERVMQLFGLVNTLLSKDADSFKRHLNITKFPAIPLSQSSGLLGWVHESDTLHSLIKEYRENRRILLNIEHRIMLQMAPQYDNLTLMQKVEVFSYAMDNTTGKDLYRVLWLKSPNSEAWLERRTNYTRSLAVMSMVGYILGLGDRHPSNLMLLRKTGKVVHIDFGDCFEVAMHREKYPERVPFRLTRMLTFAMEISNIDGSFKISSEAVMRAIRDNKESLMAVLEAFIHDPLLNWRLMTRESPYEPSFRSERRMSLIGGDEGNGRQAGGTSGRAPHFNSFMEELQANQHMPGLPNGSRMPQHNPSFRARGRTSALTGLQAQDENNRDVQNERALQVLKRVREKLTGMDFKNAEPLSVDEQVARLIAQATNIENICQHYIGWCSFW